MPQSASSIVSSPPTGLESRHCPVCGPQAGQRTKYRATFTESDLNAAIFSARRMPDRCHFQFVECAGCGMIFSNPAATAQTLAGLYRESAVTYGRQQEQIYDSYAPVLDRGLARVRQRGTFVEIGGGNGFMLAYGAKQGFHRQIEVEPSQDAERKFEPPTQNAQFIRGIFEKKTLPSNSASLICFFQMLDHVPNPLEFLEAVFDVLEPGGVAICCTHNTQALSAKLLGERSPIFDIEHTYLFHPQNLKRLFEKVGFTDTESFTMSNNYSLRYWLRLAPLPSSLKGLVVRAAELTRLAELRIALNAGNFGVVAQKKGGGL
jgi:SAM-dependent methyltransferase